MTQPQISLMFRFMYAMFCYTRRNTWDPDKADQLEADLKAQSVLTVDDDEPDRI